MTGTRLTFWGAAGQVTGSMHLLEAAGARILLDAGLFQGRRSEVHALNLQLPFDARRVDAVVLSHAHIDHTGRLPLLVKEGFHGPVYATPATRDLSAVMLADAAHIQEKDYEFLQRHGRVGLESEPLYSLRDAIAVQDLTVGVPYRRVFYVRKHLALDFLEAGHILGSAAVDLRVSEGGNHRLVFSGDIGRTGLPIVRDPEPPSGPIDTLIIEATYADRQHESFRDAESRLAEAIRRTAARGGRVMIPAFAVGRAQELIYSLHRLSRTAQIPAVPIYLDSPLAVDITTVFRMHPEVFDRREELIEATNELFDFPQLRYVREVSDSKALNASNGPAVARRLRRDPRRLRPDRRADRRRRSRARLRAEGDARRQARRLGQQAAALPTRRGAVGLRARARGAAALRGRGRGRRAGDPRAAGVARGGARGADPRHRQRHDELYPDRDGARRPGLRGGARAGAGARLRGGRPDRRRHGTRRRGQDGDPRAARFRHAGPLDQVRYEGIEHLTADDIAYAQQLGFGIKLIGTAERVDGGLSRARPPGVPLRRPSAGLGERTVQRRHGRVRRDHRDHVVRARRRRAADRLRRARRRDLGDDPARDDARDEPAARDRQRRRQRVLPAHGGRRPAAAREVAELLGMQGASIKSVVQRGLGDKASLVMVLHLLRESRLYAAAHLIGHRDLCLRCRVRSA